MTGATSGTLRTPLLPGGVEGAVCEETEREMGVDVSNTSNLRCFYMISNKLLFPRLYVDGSVQTQAKSRYVECLVSRKLSFPDGSPHFKNKCQWKIFDCWRRPLAQRKSVGRMAGERKRTCVEMCMKIMITCS